MGENGWTQWELQQRNWKYEKVPNGSNRAEKYNSCIKNYTRWFNSKLNEAEERISDLDDKDMKLSQTEYQKEKKKK